MVWFLDESLWLEIFSHRLFAPILAFPMMYMRGFQWERSKKDKKLNI